MMSTGRVIGWRVARIGWLLVSALITAAAGEGETTYHLLGVSGGLQDGFAARRWLDYHPGLGDESKATLVGYALVKGYKAYLDVKQKGWREHVEEPGHPLVNPVVVASGCAEHANIYAIYAVDSRQVLKALLMEPRFLSMAPDAGLVDLTAEETDQSVRAVARHQAGLEGKSDLDSAAFLLVTGVWAPGSLIESPVLYTKGDGTEVTDYPRSLALWAGTTDGDRRSDDETARAAYWESFRKAIRRSERQQQEQLEAEATAGADAAAADAAAEAAAGAANAGAGEAGMRGSIVAARPLHECRSQARYGSGPETVRMGREYTAEELMLIVPEVLGGRGGLAAEEL